MGVTNYLLTKYFFPNPLNTAAFQWMFDGTNITGATNSILVLTNAQSSTAGTYSVIISNIAGVATSSNAVITVHQPASISSQPQDQSGHPRRRCDLYRHGRGRCADRRSMAVQWRQHRGRDKFDSGFDQRADE